jgi:HEAT repeat protein
MAQRRAPALCTIAALVSLLPVLSRAPGLSAFQAPKAVEKIAAPQVKASVALLGAFEFPVRMDASRTVRRADSAVAVPILIETIANQSVDGYVRFRALVLLSGFNDPRTNDMMMKALADKNDRLRALAYNWFERHPDPSVQPRLVAALDREDTEFVRPALTRALIAYAADVKAAPKMREVVTGLVMKGQDLFRAVAIDALGEYRSAYALQPIAGVAKLEGPLQDDAILAIGRIGDKRGLGVLAELQQKTARTLQPSIAASICLLGSNCDSHSRYLVDSLRFAIANPGYQPLLRAAANGLAALAAAGNKEAAATLFERGAPTRDPERAPIALALGMFALRNTPVLLQVLETQADLPAAIELLREAFDMLEEDFEEERFFVAVRRAYWAAPAGSPARRIAETLIQRLEF